MNIRILLATLICFFLFQSVRAQDTVKHVAKSSKHSIKHAASNGGKDSAKAAAAKKDSYVKDTARSHKKDFVRMPKYKRDGYVALMGGFGLPAGEYASSGCASSGSVFSISAGFPGIISHCGIAFK